MRTTQHNQITTRDMRTTQLRKKENTNERKHYLKKALFNVRPIKIIK